MSNFRLLVCSRCQWTRLRNRLLEFSSFCRPVVCYSSSVRFFSYADLFAVCLGGNPNVNPFVRTYESNACRTRARFATLSRSRYELVGEMELDRHLPTHREHGRNLVPSLAARGDASEICLGMAVGRESRGLGARRSFRGVWLESRRRMARPTMVFDAPGRFFCGCIHSTRPLFGRPMAAATRGTTNRAVTGLGTGAIIVNLFASASLPRHYHGEPERIPPRPLAARWSVILSEMPAFVSILRNSSKSEARPIASSTVTCRR